MHPIVFTSSIPKSDVLVGAMYNAIADFERDKKLKRLSFNEEQIHKFDKSVSFFLVLHYV